MASLLISHGPLFGARFPLERESLIGRLAAATVQLPSAQVSRRHARIYLNRGRWVVEDLGSRNGTYLNGAKVKGAEVLTPGDGIRVGESTLIFEPSAHLLAARYGEAWILLGHGGEREEVQRGSVGSFGGSPRELAALSHLFAATVEEEGLVRGILQLITDRFEAFEVVLLRLNPGSTRPIPLGAVAPSGPIPLDGTLVELAIGEGRAMAAGDRPRLTLAEGRIGQEGGGPILVAPLEVGQELTGLLCLARRPGEPAFGQGEIARVSAIAAFSAPALENARRAHLQRRRHRAWVEPERGESLLAGSSPSSRALVDRVREAAGSEGPVLLVGAQGVGKERVARLIHAWSHRWEGPLVQIPCAAMGEAQLEMALFGRVPGSGEASPGLERGVVGKAALADGGSIYLDRVDTLSVALQDRLVRLLQCGHIWRVGASLPRTVRVRVIASSEVSLEPLAKRGVMRPELVHLLGEQIVEMPALADRMDDLEALVGALISRIAVRLGRHVSQVSDGAFDLLRQRAWPGNLRELEEVLTRAVSYSPDSVISAEDIELGADPSLTTAGAGASGRLSDALRDTERRVMEQAMRLSRDRGAEAARLLGMSLQAFERRWHLLGLDVSRL